MEYGLIGRKLAHSFSPRIHRLLAPYTYELRPLEPQEVEPFLRAGEFKGLNVTIPYKQAVMPFLETISPQAQRIGSVNTVVRDASGALHGYNTDYQGFLTLAESVGVAFEGKKVLILGTGGTSRTARTLVQDQGAREVVLVSRQGPVDYGTVYRHTDAEVVVNTTPVGMYPQNGLSPLDLSRFPNLEGVLDVVYNPLRTALLLQAERLGLPCGNGLTMLVAQAKAAAELFLGESLPQERVAQVTETLARERRNLVLIGMPGSGKTLLGRLAAKILHREFFDSDLEVERRAGRTIPELFRDRGEEAFRALETEVLQDLGKETGRVIATGGGAVLRQENQDALRQNGKLIWVVRALEQLDTQGRPLSRDLAAVEALWHEREPLYRSLADQIVENNRTPELAVREILAAF